MLGTQAVSTLQDQLLMDLAEARVRSDELFQLLRDEAFYDRPIPERHRIIFYLGHLEAFDWNLLHERLFSIPSSSAELDQLFAFGIDPVGGGLPDDQPKDWPSLTQVRQYAARTRSAIDAGLEKLQGRLYDSQAEGSDFSPKTLLHVAIEHRLMHAETLAYMWHQLPYDRKIAPVNPQAVQPTTTAAPAMISIPAGMATLGLLRSDETFGWDNEFDQYAIPVPAFEIDEFKVTNQQFLEFIQAGGYENSAYWSPADWEWKTANNIQHPVFWKQNGGAWLYRGMFSEVPLPLNSPVYASQAEASAYARWVGKSLPTEAQWHRAAYAGKNEQENQYPWGSQRPQKKIGNFDFQYWDPVAVNAHPAGRSAFGVSDLLGNGWEWTSTEFAPFPGFNAFSFYPGYSANFFDGKHFVMKGGSARTAACMLRRSFRNWFQPHYQYVYAGFRCVRD
jgi:ergothioneine biosynthesis protein EgtB